MPARSSKNDNGDQAAEVEVEGAVTLQVDSLRRPDVGGVFATDAHRRVLGSMRDEPKSAEEVYASLDRDQHVSLGSNEVSATDSVLEDLVADGYVKQTGEGYARTKKGLETLTAPPPEPEAPA